MEVLDRSNLSILRTYRYAASDYEEAESLKRLFADRRSEKSEVYLTADDFERVLRWKLINQYGRSEHLRTRNTDDLIRQVTRFALQLNHEALEYQDALRTDALCVLRGVSVPVASAVLALVYPEQYGIVDFRVWRLLYGVRRSTFGTGNYLAYLRDIRSIADELGWRAQEADLALWEMDKALNS